MAGLVSSSKWAVEKGDEKVSTLTLTTEHGESSGLRYRKRSRGIDWITRLVYSKESESSWLGVRVFREAYGPIPYLPEAKKPLIVRALLENLRVSQDGPLPFDQKAYSLCDTDVPFIASIINGRSNCHLPVVYVSAGFNESYALDAGRLAGALAGMAHVVVEPNRAFSHRLRSEVESQNVYGGTLGIFWPDNSGRRYSYYPGKYHSRGALSRAIFGDIQTALSNRRPLTRCTWAALKEAEAKNTLAALRAEGSSEVEDYVDVFDMEMKAKNEQLEEAEREIHRLQSEVQMHQVKAAGQSGIVLRKCEELDLYPGEILGFACEELEDALSRLQDGCRRKDVIASLVTANPTAGKSGFYRSSLKALLSGYKKMDPKTKRGLEDLGFEIGENGKHLRLVFQNDGRYSYTIPKTGSDHRGGKNAVSDISRLIF